MDEKESIEMLKKLLSSENEYTIIDKFGDPLSDKDIRKIDSALNKAIKILNKRRDKNVCKE